MKKASVKINKPLYLAMAILDISKTLIYEFWYVKPKYNDKAKVRYMDTDSLLLIFLLKKFLKKLTIMLKDGLIHLTMIRMIKHHFK